MDVTSRKMTQPLPAMGLNILRVKFFLLERKETKFSEFSKLRSNRVNASGSDRKLLSTSSRFETSYFPLIESILHRIL